MRQVFQNQDIMFFPSPNNLKEKGKVVLAIPIMAMLCISGLEAFAISQGIDGAVFGIVIAALAGLGGYELKIIKDRKKGGK